MVNVRFLKLRYQYAFIFPSKMNENKPDNSQSLGK